jgi:hypothetical protein
VTWGAAPVELRVALEGNQFDLGVFADGLPVVLNRASANPVSLGFRCEANGAVLTNGTLTLDPGQTRSTLTMPTVSVDRHDLLLVSLTGAQNAELLPPERLVFLRAASTASPVLVGAGSTWRYLDTGADAGTAWREVGYDDSGWPSGRAQLGFGDGDEATVIRAEAADGENTITFYFRQEFAVTDSTVFTNLVLTLLRDDGGVVYLNGAEAYRSPTLPAAPLAITYRTLANALSSSTAPADNTVDHADLSPLLLKSGINVMAVEVHQHRADSSDVSFDGSLVGEPVPPAPALTLLHGRFDGLNLLVWADPSVGLERAGEVQGPWTRVSGALSPWPFRPDDARAFFRLVH